MGSGDGVDRRNMSEMVMASMFLISTAPDFVEMPSLGISSRPISDSHF